MKIINWINDKNSGDKFFHEGINYLLQSISENSCLYNSFESSKKNFFLPDSSIYTKLLLNELIYLFSFKQNNFHNTFRCLIENLYLDRI